MKISVSHFSPWKKGLKNKKQFILFQKPNISVIKRNLRIPIIKSHVNSLSQVSLFSLGQNPKHDSISQYRFHIGTLGTTSDGLLSRKNRKHSLGFIWIKEPHLYRKSCHEKPNNSSCEYLWNWDFYFFLNIFQILIFFSNSPISKKKSKNLVMKW